MKLTGQQLRIIVRREQDAQERLLLLVDELECLKLANEHSKMNFAAFSDVLAELVLYRSLIAENTKHTSSLAFSTVSEMATHGVA